MYSTGFLSLFLRPLAPRLPFLVRRVGTGHPFPFFYLSDIGYVESTHPPRSFFIFLSLPLTIMNARSFVPHPSLVANLLVVCSTPYALLFPISALLGDGQTFLPLLSLSPLSLLSISWCSLSNLLGSPIFLVHFTQTHGMYYNKRVNILTYIYGLF